MTRNCPNDHPRSIANLRWYVGLNGKTYSQCRLCHATRMRLKYRNDDEHRRREQIRCREAYQPKFGAASRKIIPNRNTIAVKPYKHVEMTKSEMYEMLRKAVENTK